ncbi:MAG: hypothetical protein ABIA78_03765 [archaeon]
MRKIVSKQSESKKKKRNQTILGVFLVVVMLGGVFGVVVNSFGSRDKVSKKITYNGFEFVNQNGFWVTVIGDFTFGFRNNPNEVENINSELNLLNEYSGKPLYIYSENAEAAAEISGNLFYNNGIALRKHDACLEGKECEGDLPVKNCSENFIIIEESEKISVIQNESCVFIQGPQKNLTKITDGFLFKILGIEQ